MRWSGECECNATHGCDANRRLRSHGKDTTSKYYYYMWRFGWVFFLIAFIFANLAALSGLLSCIRVIAGATGLLTLAATFWLTLSVCLMR